MKADAIAELSDQPERLLTAVTIESHELEISVEFNGIDRPLDAQAGSGLQTLDTLNDIELQKVIGVVRGAD